MFSRDEYKFNPDAGINPDKDLIPATYSRDMFDREINTRARGKKRTRACAIEQAREGGILRIHLIRIRPLDDAINEHR
jgi:hypothetical protein